MAIIPQQRLFGWKEINNLGDLERLKLVLETMPDEGLMQYLEKQRGCGRNDYPIRCLWNSILAGIVYQHPSIESLRRELLRNGQLRFMCGFLDEVPPSWVYSRFLKKLLKHHEYIDDIFKTLVEELRKNLPGFGNVLAIDGKAVQTHAKAQKNKKAYRPDGRRDIDADFGVKTYRGIREDGTPWEKTKSWFGYKIHLIIDASYELPVAFHVTKASKAEVPRAHKLLEEMAQSQPEILKACKVFLGDKGYDDGKLITLLWDKHQIKPVIDIRNMWKDGEKTRLLGEHKNVTYDCRGNIFCHCPETGKEYNMAYGGFEKDRETLKYRCPAKHYGITCKGKNQCPVTGSIRVPLAENRRLFTPLARSSYSWKTHYKKRTAVERVNSRLDVSFGFENHFIRGLNKMKVRCDLAFCVMLAMALGRVRQNKLDKMRSLVRSA
jgi:transposase